MDLAVRWVQQHVAKCPICSKTDFELAEQLAALRMYHDGPDAQVFPVVMVSCKNCAAFLPFSAVLMGIVEP